MRPSTLLVAPLVFAVGLVSAQDAPKRKSGLWEITSTSTYTQNQPRYTKLCVAQAGDDALHQLAEGIRSESCKTDKMTRNGDKLLVDAVCTLRSSNAQTHAVITGNFDSAYTIESASTYNPPVDGQAKGQAVLSAKWTGPCPAGMAPGDMIRGQPRRARGTDVQETKADKQKKTAAGTTGNPAGASTPTQKRVLPAPKPSNPPAPPPAPANPPAPSQ